MNTRVKTVICAMMMVICIASAISAICIASSPPSKNTKEFLSLITILAFMSAGSMALLWPRKTKNAPKILVVVCHNDDNIIEMIDKLKESGYDVITDYILDTGKINNLNVDLVITNMFLNRHHKNNTAILSIGENEIKTPVMFILQEGIEELETNNPGYFYTSFPIHIGGMVSTIKDIIPIRS